MTRADGFLVPALVAVLLATGSSVLRSEEGGGGYCQYGMWWGISHDGTIVQATTSTAISYFCGLDGYTGEVDAWAYVSGLGGSDWDSDYGMQLVEAVASVPIGGQYGIYFSDAHGTVWHEQSGLEVEFHGGGDLDVQDPNPPPPPCAHPTNWRQNSVTIGPATVMVNGIPRSVLQGELLFGYLWDSTVGDHSNLAACQVFEVVIYDENSLGTPFSFPPPFPAIVQPNPAPLSWPANDAGGASDLHSTPGQYRTPYANALLLADQYYGFNCPCYNNNDPTVFESHIVERRVSNASGGWEASIKKANQTASKPLP